jgi:hypothetical protein
MPNRLWPIIAVMIGLIVTAAGAISFAATTLAPIVQSYARALLACAALPLIGAYVHLAHERRDLEGKRRIEQWIERCFVTGAVLFVVAIAVHAIGATRSSWLRHVPLKSMAFLGVVCLEIAISFAGLHQIKRWCAERYELWLTTQQVLWRSELAALQAKRQPQAERVRDMKVRLAVLRAKQAASESYIQAIGHAAAKISPPSL